MTHTLRSLSAQNFETADDKIARLEKEANAALSGNSVESQDGTGQVDETASAPETGETENAATETEQPAEQQASQSEEQQTNNNEQQPEEQQPKATEKSDAHLQVASDKGKNRVQELANERNELATKVPQLEREVQRLQKLLGLRGNPNQGRPGTQSAAPQNQKPADPNLPEFMRQNQTGEMSAEELQQIIDTRTKTQFANQRLLDTLDYDIDTVEERYPELRAPTKENPNPVFDEKLTDNISRWYQTLFEKDNSLRFSDFVESILSLKHKGLEEGKKQAQSSASDILRQQDAEQALDSSPASPSEGQSTDITTKIRSARNKADLAEVEKLLPHAQ